MTIILLSQNPGRYKTCPYDNPYIHLQTAIVFIDPIYSGFQNDATPLTGVASSSGPLRLNSECASALAVIAQLFLPVALI
jgi:hypothetical protein